MDVSSSIVTGFSVGFSVADFVLFAVPDFEDPESEPEFEPDFGDLVVFVDVAVLPDFEDFEDLVDFGDVVDLLDFADFVDFVLFAVLAFEEPESEPDFEFDPDSDPESDPEFEPELESDSEPLLLLRKALGLSNPISYSKSVSKQSKSEQIIKRSSHSTKFRQMSSKCMNFIRLCVYTVCDSRRVWFRETSATIISEVTFL